MQVEQHGSLSAEHKGHNSNINVFNSIHIKSVSTENNNSLNGLIFHYDKDNSGSIKTIYLF